MRREVRTSAAIRRPWGYSLLGARSLTPSFPLSGNSELRVLKRLAARGAVGLGSSSGANPLILSLRPPLL